MADTFLFAQLQPFTLAGAGAVLGDTSLTLISMNGIDGTALAMTDFGLIGYGTLEPNAGTQEEQISFTGLVQNANGTATLTGVKNVGFLAPYTETSGLAKTHAGGTQFVISNTSGFYNRLTAKGDDETITGTWTFTNPNYPRMDTATPPPTDDEQFATKKYVDDTAIAGAPDATNTVKGITKLSVAAASPTDPIAVGTNDNRVSPVSLATVTAGQVAALPSTTTPSSSNKYITQTDFQKGAEISGSTTGSTNAYVFTPSPAIAALTAGMCFRLKANFTNTSAATLNTSALGAVAIKKGDGTVALSSGDIVSGQEFVVVYDGTNYQMVSPVGNAPVEYTYITNTFPTNNTFETFMVPILATSSTAILGWSLVTTTASTTSAANYIRMGGSAAADFTATTLLPGSGSTDNYSPAQSKAIRIKARLKFGDLSDRKGFGLCVTAANIHTAQTDTTNGEVRFILNGSTMYAQNANGTATSTDVSSGITFTNWNLFEIVFTPGTDIKYYINGTLVATHTTNLPTTGTLILAYGANANGRTIDTTYPIISIQN